MRWASGDHMQTWLKAYLLTLMVGGAALAYVGLPSWFLDLLHKYFGFVWTVTTLMSFVLFVMLPAFLYALQKSVENQDQNNDT